MPTITDAIQQWSDAETPEEVAAASEVSLQALGEMWFSDSPFTSRTGLAGKD